jgi:hypothetical protein
MVSVRSDHTCAGGPVVDIPGKKGGNVVISRALSKVRTRMRAAPQLLRAKRAVWAAGRRILPPGDTRIVESFPLFTPYSIGSARKKAALTIQAADQTFPLLRDLLSHNGMQIEEPVAIERFVDTADKRAAADELRDLFDQYGSDKSSYHDYHLLYGPILADREAITNLLEIGIGTNNPDVISNMGIHGKPGASLRAFRDFLSNAKIYGADVDRRILFTEERITTLFVDQTDLRSFDPIADAVGPNIDLIIDDGLHSPNANLATLLFGLERLKIGGWLVVEDIAPAALPLWQVVASVVPQSFDCHVVDAKGALLFSVQRTA